MKKLISKIIVFFKSLFKSKSEIDKLHDQLFKEFKNEPLNLSCDNIPLLNPMDTSSSKYKTFAEATKKVVTVYYELDYGVYNYFGKDIAKTTKFLNDSFQYAKDWYARFGIYIQLREGFVVTDPTFYTTQDKIDSSYLLSAFRTKRKAFNGDVAVLMTNLGVGGMASAAGGLGTEYNTCAGGYTPVFNPDLNIYSRYTEVLIHELGHLLGSVHSHECAWNGDNTSIDNHGRKYGNIKTDCKGNPFTITGKSTFMGYGDSVRTDIAPYPNAGVDMSTMNPQIQAVILNHIASQTCLGDGTKTCIDGIYDLVPTKNNTIQFKDLAGNDSWKVAVKSSGNYPADTIINRESHAPVAKQEAIFTDGKQWIASKYSNGSYIGDLTVSDALYFNSSVNLGVRLDSLTKMLVVSDYLNLKMTLKLGAPLKAGSRIAFSVWEWDFATNKTVKDSGAIYVTIDPTKIGSQELVIPISKLKLAKFNRLQIRLDNYTYSQAYILDDIVMQGELVIPVPINEAAEIIEYKPALLPNTYYTFKISPNVDGLSRTPKEIPFVTSPDLSNGQEQTITDIGKAIGNYFPNQNYNHFISAATGKTTTIKFTEFKIEPVSAQGYAYDYMEVFIDEVLVAKLTGDMTSKLPSYTTTKDVRLHFVSDRGTQDKGYQAKVKQI